MNVIRKIISAVAAIIIMPLGLSAQTAADSVAVCPPDAPDEVRDETGGRLLGASEIAVATDTIIANYDSEWKELTMQGKLQFEGLPMRVNVKIYMKRGESVIMSARAPIFGEVARVEICQDSIVLINKHTRTYNVQSLGSFAVDRRAFMADLQDILLGQVAYPGLGRLTHELASASQWIGISESDVLLYPSPDVQPEGVEYGFVMNPEDWHLLSFVLMLGKTGTVIETSYLYGEEGWTLGLGIELRNKKTGGEVQLTYPDYNPAPLEFTQLGGKYRKVDIKELMRF